MLYATQNAQHAQMIRHAYHALMDCSCNQVIVFRHVLQHNMQMLIQTNALIASILVLLAINQET